MKPYALCGVLVLVGTLALFPPPVQAQAAAESAIATGATGNLGAKVASALGAATQHVLQTVPKELAKPTSLNLDANRKAAAAMATKRGASTVRIDSKPPGAMITVDNIALGRTPASLTLPKGIHIFELRHDGYLPWQKAILMGEGEKLSLSPALKDPKTSRPIFSIQR